MIAPATTHVLLVEDDACDAEIVFRSLRSARKMDYCIKHVSTLSEAFSTVFQAAFDVILLDLGLPDGVDFEGVNRLVDMLDIPVIVLTGNDNPELAERALASGAQDYVPKSDNLSLVLHRTIQFSIRRHQTHLDRTRETHKLTVHGEFSRLQAARIQAQLDRSERLAEFTRSTEACVAILSEDGRIEWANTAFESYCGSEPEGLRNMPISEVLSEADQPAWNSFVRTAMAEHRPWKDCRLLEAAGSMSIFYRVEVIPFRTPGKAKGFAFSFLKETLQHNTMSLTEATTLAESPH
ncbi:MAG: response regulator [Planctomycetaceae bacterium]|nr:response regulator [Planctomycetaceae bacterium]